MASKFDQRTDYTLNSVLDEKEMKENPFDVFHQWYDIALEQVEKDPNAMTLSTFDGEFPRGRMVLLKELDEKGFVYFTNYDSDKVKEGEAHPKVSLTFYWKELERQVRVEGIIERISEAESDEYFDSRPEGSKIGAWASVQSREIPDRKWLEERVVECGEKFPGKVSRPEFWGGLRIVPSRFEFWQGQSSRLHDRIIYVKEGSVWQQKRLAP